MKSIEILKLAEIISKDISLISGEVGKEQMKKPLKSIFNVLNKNNQNMVYAYEKTMVDSTVKYPSETEKELSDSEYAELLKKLDDLEGKVPTEYNEYSGWLAKLEENFTFVRYAEDISVYDHVRLKHGIGNCLEQYSEHKQIPVSYFEDKEKLYEEQIFILASMDVSGIQNFIYTITTKNALKTLRARSFYLELVMEHIVDSLLSKLHLTRANLIYSGGGHSYLLLPNIENIKADFYEAMDSVNEWFLKHFDISLFVASSAQECCVNELRNYPNESYKELYKKVSKGISLKKSHRYSPKQIIEMNFGPAEKHSKECKICHAVGRLNSKDICPICQSLVNFSGHILDDEKKNSMNADFFVVMQGEGGLPLPTGYHLKAVKDSEIASIIKDENFVRAYSKNGSANEDIAYTKLSVGSYSAGNSFEEFAEKAGGIDRIAIIRADVDNLGNTFMQGFDEKHNCLARTATLSRHLSLFFKYYINGLMQNPDFNVLSEQKVKKARDCTIVYSGGDDMFIAGAWNELINFSIDLSKAFRKYTQGMLGFSAGIGLYEHHYPVSVIAEEVAILESKSKKLPGKDAVTLFEDGSYHEENGNKISDGTYRWEELEKEVLGEKFEVLANFFDLSEDRGKSFLYKLLELIRNQEDKINFARFVYLLARLEPSRKKDSDGKESEAYAKYKRFSNKMTEWIKNPKDRRQLKTAIVMYVYLSRESEGK